MGEVIAVAHGMGGPESENASLGELAKGLAQDASALVRQEIELAKVELRGKARTAAPGLGMLVAAGVVGLALLGALTAALILLVALILPAWAAALVVTGFWGVVAGGLAVIGRSRLRAAGPLVPEDTVESLRKDIEVAKDAARSRPADGRPASGTN
jgi:hypothetical protein